MGGLPVNALVCRYRGQRDREPLHDPASGLDYVYLLSGYTPHETKYGPCVSFEDVFGLHRVIGRHLATRTRPLTGKELLFLRVEWDLSKVQLGRLLRVSDQEVAGWENEACAIPGPADILFRCMYLQHLGDNVDLRAFSEGIQDRERLARGHGPGRSKEAWRVSLMNPKPA